MFIVFEMMSRMEFAVLEMNINQIKPNYLSFLSGKNNYFVRLVSTSLEFLLCIMWQNTVLKLSNLSALENIKLSY